MPVCTKIWSFRAMNFGPCNVLLILIAKYTQGLMNDRLD